MAAPRGAALPFRPEAILAQAKNNNAAGIRALVDAGVPVQYCNQVSVCRLVEGVLPRTRPNVLRWACLSQARHSMDACTQLVHACLVHVQACRALPTDVTALPCQELLPLGPSALQIGQTALHVAALW